MRNLRLIIPLIVLSFSCNKEQKIEHKKLYDFHGTYVGDSVFLNNKLQKILLRDTAYNIDSVVFTWNKEANNIKSERTYLKGKMVFENIDYYENGSPKTYLFVDEDSSDYFFKIEYWPNGEVIKTVGEIFFQPYLTGFEFPKLRIKAGNTARFDIYFPNPPRFKTNLFIKFGDCKKGYVFYQDSFINFKKYVKMDAIKSQIGGKYNTDIGLEVFEPNKMDTLNYHHPIYFRVIE